MYDSSGALEALKLFPDPEATFEHGRVVLDIAPYPQCSIEASEMMLVVMRNSSALLRTDHSGSWYALNMHLIA